MDIEMTIFSTLPLELFKCMAWPVFEREREREIEENCKASFLMEYARTKRAKISSATIQPMISIADS